MTDSFSRVKDAAAFAKAIEQGAANIEIEGRISELSSVKLPAGTNVRGAGGDAELHFKESQPGLMLSANHQISGLRLVADETQLAIGLSDDAEDLGDLAISNVRTVGRFHLEASMAKRGNLKLDSIHVERADARMAAHRPAGFGVEVLLGALSVYNASKDKASHWTLEAHKLSGGSKDHPLRGSGVFIFGGWFIPVDADPAEAPAPTQEGGTIELKLATTGEVYTDGGIPKGTGNLITGGVFIGSGVHAHGVINEGPLTTYGPNDMVLDNWGKIDTWTAQDKVVSFGSSGIGFVNFGDIDYLNIKAPIETYGVGARGFNLYDGSLKKADFQSITTHGDGAIGVQLSKPFGSITIAGDIRTKGGEGESLVRGKVIHLKAHALSLKPGTKGQKFSVAGEVIAENKDVQDYDFAAPANVISQFDVSGRKVAS